MAILAVENGAQMGGRPRFRCDLAPNGKMLTPNGAEWRGAALMIDAWVARFPARIIGQSEAVERESGAGDGHDGPSLDLRAGDIQHLDEKRGQSLSAEALDSDAHDRRAPRTRRGEEGVEVSVQSNYGGVTLPSLVQNEHVGRPC